MSPLDCAYAAIRGIYFRETAVWICPLYYKIFVPLLQIFPTLQAWYLKRRLREQLSTIAA